MTRKGTRRPSNHRDDERRAELKKQENEKRSARLSRERGAFEKAISRGDLPIGPKVLKRIRVSYDWTDIFIGRHKRARLASVVWITLTFKEPFPKEEIDRRIDQAFGDLQ